MKGFFAFHIAVIVFASLMAFYVLNYIPFFFNLAVPGKTVNLTVPPHIINPHTFIVVGFTWSIGLFWTRHGFDTTFLVKKNPNATKPFSFKDHWKREHEDSSNNGQTLGEVPPQGDPDPEGPPDNPKPKTMQMSDIVQGTLSKSMEEATLDVTLEFEKGTPVNVFGQACRITKGTIRLRPKKEEKLFSRNPKTRRKRF